MNAHDAAVFLMTALEGTTRMTYAIAEGDVLEFGLIGEDGKARAFSATLKKEP